MLGNTILIKNFNLMNSTKNVIKEVNRLKIGSTTINKLQQTVGLLNMFIHRTLGSQYKIKGLGLKFIQTSIGIN